MAGMLMMEPEDRYTAADCLADPYFDNIREPEVDKLLLSYKINTNAAAHTSQARIRQESSKSRSSIRSNTVEREAQSIQSNIGKNKTQYG